jgi:hypothetical protein
MAARSTHVTVINRAGRLNLVKLKQELDHGVWSSEPPALIGNLGTWMSESDGFATGTEGRVVYQIQTDEGELVGQLRLGWDNPFVGSNEYSESVSPQATSATTPGFSVVHVGGGGDNAEVTFELLDGFCSVNDAGEISCAVASPVVSDKQRLAAIWEATPGPNWFAVHGLTNGQYQQRFDELVGQGFRPVDVSGYDVGGEDRYAAIFEQREGPAFAARHGLTNAQYQQTFDELVGQGFRLVDVSGYEVDGQDRYAAIFEQRPGPAFVARHGLTNQQYQAAFDEFVGQGFRLRRVSGYAVNGQDFYAAIWEADGGPSFAARHNLSNPDYQAAFDEFVGQGFRLRQVSGYNVNGKDRYAAIWEADGGPAFTARHGLNSDQYQRTFDRVVAEGFRLTNVSGYSVG